MASSSHCAPQTSGGTKGRHVHLAPQRWPWVCALLLRVGINNDLTDGCRCEELGKKRATLRGIKWVSLSLLCLFWKNT